MNLVPIVIEKSGKGERAWDIYSRLLEERIVFITGCITPEMASTVVAQLLFLQSTNSSREVSMYIGSPGGYVSAGMAIYDTMQFIKPDIRTICVGEAASMGAMLVAAGTKGMRSILPNARMMIHQPSGGMQGQTTDIQIQAAEIQRVKDNLKRVFAIHTGRPEAEIEADVERDNYKSAIEAVEYGLVDEIVANLE